MGLSWTPEEIAEMKRFDCWLDQTFRLTKKEILFSRRVDRIARLERLEEQRLKRETLRSKRRQLAK